jgi:NTP pyrophosphatase (non-canonical NTP hydrolase)
MNLNLNTTVDVSTTKDMADRLEKLYRKRRITAADRREANDIVWMLKRMADDHLEHKCLLAEVEVDYNESYAKRALRTEHTRAFANDAEGKPDMHLSLLLHAVAGLATESGEALDALKKTLVYGKPVDEVNLLEEAGDIKWYLALLLRTLGKTDRLAGELNIQKLLVRYPNKFSEAQAQKPRDLVAERAVFTAPAPGLRTSIDGMAEKIAFQVSPPGAHCFIDEICVFCSHTITAAAPGVCPGRTGQFA